MSITPEDRELLKLAAKAGGYSSRTFLDNEYVGGQALTGHYSKLLEECTNPLTDNADAFMLAVTLSLDIKHSPRHVFVGEFSEIFEPVTEHVSREVATRKAITRAAAEIGKTLP
jgi:hypothetical protein